jgi:hypothetical protein
MKPENLTILKKLIGINTMNLHKYLKSNRILFSEYSTKSRGTAVENAIALLISESLPGNQKGPDFNDFEVKTVQIKWTGLKEMRTCGDTFISKVHSQEVDFMISNTWKKLKSMISVIVYEDVIIDILYFCGDSYKGQLASEYSNILCGENNFFRKDKKTWRQVEGVSNKLLVRKDYKNGNQMVSMPGNNVLKLSESVCGGFSRDIDNQDDYLRELFSELTTKFLSTSSLVKKKFDIKEVLNGYSKAELDEVIRFAMARFLEL